MGHFLQTAQHNCAAQWFFSVRLRNFWIMTEYCCRPPVKPPLFLCVSFPLSYCALACVQSHYNTVTLLIVQRLQRAIVLVNDNGYSKIHLLTSRHCATVNAAVNGWLMQSSAPARWNLVWLITSSLINPRLGGMNSTTPSGRTHLTFFTTRLPPEYAILAYWFVCCASISH
jgi:hypothetical protein